MLGVVVRNHRVSIQNIVVQLYRWERISEKKAKFGLTAIGKTNRTMSAVNATEAAISGAAWAAAQMGPIPFAPETNLW